MSARKLSLVALALMPSAAHPSPPFIAKLDRDHFFESNSPDVNVSGSVIVGVLGNNASGGDSIQGLQLTNPVSPRETSDSPVCLTVQSRDGAYFSRNTFNLPGGSGGNLVRIPYDKSKFLDKLKRYSRNELAMLATPGKCENKTNGYYVIDAAATKPPESIRVFINSFGATDVFYRAGGGSFVPCTPISEGRRTSFDYWCDVPWPRGGKLNVDIQRERFGREMPAVALPLFMKTAN
ncbi:MAG: hypothetical protein R6W97_06320 [Thiobacillus sp.]